MYRFIIYLLLPTLFISLTRCKTSSNATAKAGKPIRVLVVGGGTSHNFGMWYRNVDGQTLSRDGFATVNYVGDPDSMLTYLPQTDVLYLSNNRPITNPAVRQAIMDHANAGKGLLIAHAAMWYNWKDWPEYNLNLVSGGTRKHDKYGTFDVTVTDTNHPITKGVEQKFSLKDERYYYIPDPAGPGIMVLASSSLTPSDPVYPSVFIVKHPKARIVGLALGHDAESHNLPVYQTLLRNSVAWAGRR
ncbi:ThuA domain-containing protein [Spirosoma sp. BT702]|uniref:ThuA domain-containing protein n=1 Tax=Spirosoma profusum TaxID=2771354 RepID=A0A926XZ23_9BACT|nr:ThuA domain-containing protein [Spirosoma profusum]MBD2703554.1 ThuA domain-containing protein [Spirosoma profusum]